MFPPGIFSDALRFSAVNEVYSGALQSFIVHADGTLSAPQDTVSSDGGNPAFTAALSTGQVAVMNYNTGNGLIVPTTGSPLLFNKDTPLISFPQTLNAISHPHMVLEHHDEILVSDLVKNTPSQY